MTFIKTAIMTFIALIVMGILLFPVYYAFVVSLKPSGSLATTKIDLIPSDITLKNYREVFFGHYEGSASTSDAIMFDAELIRISIINLTTDVLVEMRDVSGNITPGYLLTLQFAYITSKTEGENFIKVFTEEASAQGLVSGISFNAREVIVKIYKGSIEDVPIPTENLVLINNNTFEGHDVSGVISKKVRLRLENAHITVLNPKLVNIYKIGGKTLTYMRNSFILASLNVAFTLLFVVPAAYAFSRVKFVGRDHVLYFYLLFTQVSGGLGIAGLIALYALLVKLKLMNNLAVLALIYAAGGVPFNTWLLKTYMDTIPIDFDEAALVDGAGYWKIVWKIIFPMALPGVVTVSIFAFIGGWTELILANLLITEESLRPLAVQLYIDLGNVRELSWTYFSAMAIIFALPVSIMFFVSQKWIKGGLTLGGLKD
ncbi:MAG: sugar ABC transporter permease [Thermoplasmata archaeon]|nr:MAG: sugar ABC transporter permease [Thermoplasmata archaeon]